MSQTSQQYRHLSSKCKCPDFPKIVGLTVLVAESLMGHQPSVDQVSKLMSEFKVPSNAKSGASRSEYDLQFPIDPWLRATTLSASFSHPRVARAREALYQPAFVEQFTGFKIDIIGCPLGVATPTASGLGAILVWTCFRTTRLRRPERK
jgi:hypothetical protein